MRILVVDDEELLARSIARTLREHEVVISTSAVAAREHVERGEPFDLVLSDLNMPGANGAILLHDMRSWFGADAPVLVLMSGGVVDTASDCDAVLAKPFDRPRLQEVVALAGARRATRLRAATIRLPRIA